MTSARTMGSGQAATYDWRNRMATYGTMSYRTGVEYAYDAANRRVSMGTFNTGVRVSEVHYVYAAEGRQVGDYALSWSNNGPNVNQVITLALNTGHVYFVGTTFTPSSR